MRNWNVPLTKGELYYSNGFYALRLIEILLSFIIIVIIITIFFAVRLSNKVPTRYRTHTLAPAISELYYSQMFALHILYNSKCITSKSFPLPAKLIKNPKPNFPHQVIL